MIAATSFTAVGNSVVSFLLPGQRASYTVTGGMVGTLVLEEVGRSDQTTTLTNVAGTAVSLTGNGSGVVANDTQKSKKIRFRCTAFTSGTGSATLTDLASDTCAVGLGTVQAVTGLSAVERGAPDGSIHQTTLRFDGVPVTVADTAQGVGTKIYAFPAGRILILGATGTLAMTTTSVLASTLKTGVSCRWGLGTTTQANATLATTEQDLIPVTTVTASATINISGATANAALAASAQFDGTATSKNAFLNVSVVTATDIDADATVLLSGFATMTWVNLGDY